MSDLDSIVSVNISLAASSVSRAGFGTPLIAAYHNAYPDRVRSFSSLTEAASAGHTAGSPIYRALTVAFSQNPRPPIVKVGRRASAPTQIVRLTPVDTTPGVAYSVRIVLPTRLASTATYTVQAADTVALIVDGLKTAIDGLGLNLTTSDDTTHLTVTADNAGELFSYTVNPGCRFHNTTADPGLAADLTAINAADDDWYGLAIDSNSGAENLVAATWAEANSKLAVLDSADTLITVTGDTTHHFYTASQTAYERAGFVYSAAGGSLSYAGLGLLANRLPTDPGKSTWGYKRISGVQADVLSSSQTAAIEAVNGNYYVQTRGLNFLRDGTVASGQFFDVRRTIDLIRARIQENVLSLIVNNEKIPFTDSGIELVKAEILATITREVGKGIAADPAPTVTAPRKGSISTANITARNLPDVEFSATLSGAIHTVSITGKVSA